MEHKDQEMAMSLSIPPAATRQRPAALALGAAMRVAAGGLPRAEGFRIRLIIPLRIAIQPFGRPIWPPSGCAFPNSRFPGGRRFSFRAFEEGAQTGDDAWRRSSRLGADCAGMS